MSDDGCASIGLRRSPSRCTGFISVWSRCLAAYGNSPEPRRGSDPRSSSRCHAAGRYRVGIGIAIDIGVESRRGPIPIPIPTPTPIRSLPNSGRKRARVARGLCHYLPISSRGAQISNAMRHRSGAVSPTLLFSDLQPTVYSLQPAWPAPALQTLVAATRPRYAKRAGRPCSRR